MNNRIKCSKPYFFKLKLQRIILTPYNLSFFQEHLKSILHHKNTDSYKKSKNKKWVKLLVIYYNITEEAINLKVQLIVPVHNKTQTFGMNRITSNLNGIPAIETELVTA